MSGSHRRDPSAAQRRRAEAREARDAAERESGLPERVPAPKLSTRRPAKHGAPRAAAPRPTGPPWYRRPRVQVVVGGTALVLAVVARVLAPSDDDEPAAPPSDLGAGLMAFGADWKAPDGTAYRISVTPLNTFTSRGSADGCVPAPTDGFVNARFAVVLENRSQKSAPVPAVEFGANVDDRGDPDPTVLHLPDAAADVAVGPAAKGAGCGASSGISSVGRDRLDAGEKLELVGVIGRIAVPVEPGMAVIVQYVEADPAGGATAKKTEVLAPFPAFPTGS